MGAGQISVRESVATPSSRYSTHELLPAFTLFTLSHIELRTKCFYKQASSFCARCVFRAACPFYLRDHRVSSLSGCGSVHSIFASRVGPCIFSLATALSGCGGGNGDSVSQPSAASLSQSRSTVLAVQPAAAFIAAPLKGLAGKCLHVAGNNQTPGTRVQLYGCNDTDAQRWALDGTQLKSSAGLCLDVSGGLSDNGTNIVVWTCHGGQNQQWSLDGGQLKSAASGKCLDVYALNTADEARITLWDCNGGVNQQWTTTTTAGGTTPPSQGHVTNPTLPDETPNPEHGSLLTAETSRPNSNIYVDGESVVLNFSVVAGNDQLPLQLLVDVQDEYSNSIQTQSIPVALKAGRWHTTFNAPAAKRGFYRVRAKLSNETTFPALGSRPAGTLTYTVAVEPALRPHLNPAEAKFGIQGGFNSSANVLPYLGVRWVNDSRFNWGNAEPNSTGEFAISRLQSRKKGQTGPSTVVGATKGYEWCRITKDGVNVSWEIYPSFSLYANPPSWAVQEDHRNAYTAPLNTNGKVAWPKFLKEVSAAVLEDFPTLQSHFFQVTWEPNYFNGSKEDFVSLYADTVSEISSKDPKAQIAGPTKVGMLNFSSDQDSEWFGLGLGNKINAYATHPYYERDGSTDKTAEQNKFLVRVRDEMDFVRLKSGKNLPFYSTEQGYPTFDDVTKELEQAQSIVRTSLMLLGEGYRQYIGFYIHDYGTEGYGYFYNLLPNRDFGSPNLSPKPIVAAYSAESFLLDGSESGGPVNLPGDTQLGYAFRKDNNFTLALWDYGASPTVATIRVGNGPVKVIDWMGNSTDVSPSNGSIRVNLGRSPVYVKGESSFLYPSAVTTTDHANNFASNVSRSGGGSDFGIDVSNSDNFVTGTSSVNTNRDESRFVRDSDKDESLTWNFIKIQTFSTRIWNLQGQPNIVSFSSSSDNSTWFPVEVKSTDKGAGAGNWRYNDFTPKNPLPLNTNFIQVKLARNAGVPVWATQIGLSRFTYEQTSRLAVSGLTPSPGK